MGKVSAMKQGYAGKIFKTAGDQVVVMADPADAGIRVKTGQNRVTIVHPYRLARELRAGSMFSVSPVFRCYSAATTRHRTGAEDSTRVPVKYVSAYWPVVVCHVPDSKLVEDCIS